MTNCTGICRHFWDQQSCENPIATITHVSRHFQVRHIPGLGFLNGENGRRATVFIFMVGASKDRWRLMFTEISCQISTWGSGMSRKIRLFRQQEFTTASKRASLNSVQIGAITSGLIFHPSPARPSPSRICCSHDTSHEETYFNFAVDNIDFRFVSAHLFEAFVEQSMGLCQLLPFRALFQCG